MRCHCCGQEIPSKCPTCTMPAVAIKYKRSPLQLTYRMMECAAGHRYVELPDGTTMRRYSVTLDARAVHWRSEQPGPETYAERNRDLGHDK